MRDGAFGDIEKFSEKVCAEKIERGCHSLETMAIIDCLGAPNEQTNGPFRVN